MEKKNAIQHHSQNSESHEKITLSTAEDTTGQ